MSDRFCDDIKCLRRVLHPHIYCDKHRDFSSTPVDASVKAALRTQLDNLMEQIVVPEFVSFEACRTTADYDERQALIKQAKAFKSVIQQAYKELGE